MKKFQLLLIFGILTFFNAQAQVTNTSYVTEYGEKALQLSIVVPLSVSDAWKLFTTDEGLKKWIAPVAKIDMRTGGVIRTNYDPKKSADDSTAIKLNIVNYLQNELLTLKVNLNNNFPPEARKEDQNLQELLQFVKVDEGHTKIISTMIGWGKGKHWDTVYTFFERGNAWTFNEMLKLFQK